MHQPAAEVAELLHEAVDAEDHLGRRHRALRRARGPGAALASQLDHRRVLVEVDLRPEPRREGADVVRRLDQHRARRVEAAEVVVAAGDLAHLRGIDPPERLADRFERRGEALVELHPPLARGGVDLAAGVEGRRRHPVFGRRRPWRRRWRAGSAPSRAACRSRRRTEYSPDDRLCGTSIMKPEFRPAGPCASSRASRTTIRSPGRSCVSRRAAERPAKPAPMISQSAVTSASSARAGKLRREIASHPTGRCRPAGA